MNPLLPSPRSVFHALLLTALPMWAAAQPAGYRCESGGKVTYQSQPCPGGKALAPADQPSAQSQRDAQDAAARDKANAVQMERERVARERAARPGGAAVIGQPPAKPQPSTHAKKKKRKKGESEYFTAQSPKPPKPPKAPKKPKAAKKASTTPVNAASAAR